MNKKKHLWLTIILVVVVIPLILTRSLKRLEAVSNQNNIAAKLWQNPLADNLHIRINNQLPVTIDRLNNNDARLSWSHNPAYGNYLVWRDESPYFTPGGTPHGLVSQAPWQFADLGVLGNPSTNYYYWVEGVPIANELSNHVAEFDFAFTASATNQPVYVTCNNTLSDAADINATIAGTLTGAEIVISGQCLINQTIKLLGDRAYRGESLGTILKQANGANLVALLATDTFLEDRDYTGTPISINQMTLDGNKANNTAPTAGIILRSWLSRVEELQITDMGGDGLKLTNLSANSTPFSTTTQVNGSITGNFITGSDGHGIFVEDTQNAISDWTLVDNWIADSGLDGIHLENAAGWIIERNHIYGVPGHGIYAHRIFGTTISDNYIEGFGETTAAGDWYGIFATVQGDSASTIIGNRVFNYDLGNFTPHPTSTYRYIGFTVNYNNGIVSVMGNSIRGAGTLNETGLYYSSNPGTFLQATSIGNAIENVTTARFVDTNVTISVGQ